MFSTVYRVTQLNSCIYFLEKHCLHHAELAIKISSVLLLQKRFVKSSVETNPYLVFIWSATEWQKWGISQVCIRPY